MKTVGIYLFLIISLLLSGQTSYAQKKKIENLPKFDRKKLHFGFSIGLNSSDFVVDRMPDFQSFDSLKVIESQAMPGFNLGIIADYHITPVFNLRFIPALSFAQRNLEYTFSTPNSNGGFTRVIKPVESTFLDFPLNFKYRSARLNNFAAYIVGGFKYSIDLASQKDVTGVFGEEIVKLSRHDYSYEVGVGFDFFLEYFKFSPEIKLSFGIPNLIIKDGTLYSDPIRRLTSRIILISFHFEG